MDGLGLADFLSELRAELAEAQRRSSGDPLKLALGPVELSLEVAYTLEKSGEADAKVKAKFWVLEFGEAGASGSVRSERMRTQHLKLVLTPRVEEKTVDASGAVTTVSRGVDVHGQIEAQEERAPFPAPPTGG